MKAKVTLAIAISTLVVFAFIASSFLGESNLRRNLHEFQDEGILDDGLPKHNCIHEQIMKDHEIMLSEEPEEQHTVRNLASSVKYSECISCTCNNCEKVDEDNQDYGSCNQCSCKSCYEKAKAPESPKSNNTETKNETKSGNCSGNKNNTNTNTTKGGATNTTKGGATNTSKGGKSDEGKGEADNGGKSDNDNGNKDDGKYKPIRILFDMSTVVDGTLNAESVSYLKDKQFPLIKKIMQKWMKVVPVTKENPITIPKYYRSCIGAVFPQEHRDNPVSDHDIIIYIIAATERASWIANAGACLLGNKANMKRPVVGRVQYNTNYISTSPKALEGNIDTSVHELTHIFFFSGGLYRHYVNENAETLGQDKVYQDGKIITSKVLEVVREHFAYPEMSGAPIENNGGGGSAGSHWERVHFHNEFMTASSIRNGVFSKISFALAEDSGWYKMDYSQTQPFIWGKGAGKDFVENGCKATSAAAKQYFCSGSDTGCSFDKAGYGPCRRDSFADDCKYYSPYSNRICHDPTSAKPGSFGVKLKGEAFGAGSKCFDSSFQLKGYNYNMAAIRCHTVKCTGDSLQITIGSKNDKVVCGANDKGQKKTHENWGGSITCPVDYTPYCDGYKQCFDSEGNLGCNGNGICLKGKCECTPGFSGKTCENQQ